MSNLEPIKTKQPVIVGIDNGFYGTKIYCKGQTIYLRSRYEQSNDTVNKRNTYHLELNGKDYIVGEGAGISSLDADKTSNELYKIITYAGLSMLSNYLGEYFYLVGSYPLNIYNQNKEQFANYLKGEGFFQTKLDGEDKTFTIMDAMTFPQGISHAYNNLKLFDKQVRGVLDFGGLTINCVILDDLNIIPGTPFTENLGSIILYNDIKKNLDKRFNQNIQPYEVPTIIKSGLKINGRLEQESISIIKSTITEHILKIKKAMKANNWNVDSLELFITGGSSLDFHDELLSIFPQAIFSTDPVNDGAKGLHRIGELMYNN